MVSNNLLVMMAMGLISMSAWSESPHCTASYTHMTDAAAAVTEVAELEIESQSATHLQLAKNFEGRGFFALFFRDTQELLMQIVVLEDDTRGQVVRGSFDSKGSMSLTEVMGSTVYRLVCVK